MKKNPISFWVIVGIAFLMLLLQYLRYPNHILSWDVFGYYSYLPFTFIYNDLALDHAEVLHSLYHQYHPSSTLYQAYEGQPGNWMFRYTFGLALLKFPFFILGHLTALIGGWKADGYSAPYEFFIHLGGLVYALIAFYLLRRILSVYFSDRTVGITLLVLFLATNLVIHIPCYGQGAMPHNYALFLYSTLLFFTIRFYQSLKRKYILLAAVAAGILILSRPSEIVCLIIPLAWGMRSLKEIPERIKWLWKQKVNVVLFVTILLVIGFPQLLYWKLETGKFFFNSYNNPGEGMEFFRPFILEMLFSYRKGWFVYTPIMLLASFGFVYLWKRKTDFGLTILLYFIPTIYIVGSWSNYWYTESFSQRSMIPSYACMAFLMASLVEYATQRGIRILLFSGISFALILNLFQAWQFDRTILHESRMTKEYYWAVFGQTSDVTADQKKLLWKDHTMYNGIGPDSEEYKNLKVTFSDGEISNKDSVILIEAGKDIHILEGVYANLVGSSYAWVKFEFELDSTVVNPSQLVMETKVEHNHFAYGFYWLKASEIKQVSPGKYQFYYLFPEIRRKDKDVFFIKMINQSDKSTSLKSWNVQILEPVRDVHVF